MHTNESRVGSSRPIRSIAGAVAILGLLVASGASGSPSAATWRRQTLVGENADHFLRYVTTRVQPGMYDSYSQTLRLEKVRKSDFRVMESFLLRDVSYWQDDSTERWSEKPAPVPAFDLARYLRVNDVQPPFAEDLIRFRTFAIDSAGVWEVFDDGRVQLATRKELERQIPMLGEDPRVVGIESTGPCCPEREKGDVYLRISSNSGDWDADWYEDLLLLRRVELR